MRIRRNSIPAMSYQKTGTGLRNRLGLSLMATAAVAVPAGIAVALAEVYSEPTANLSSIPNAPAASNLSFINNKSGSTPATDQSKGPAENHSSLDAEISSSSNSSAAVHQSTTISTSTVDNTTHSSLTVNGQPIKVPQNGSISRTIHQGGNTTTIHLNTSSGTVGTED